MTDNDKGGLEGIVVARSRMCSIDGQKGILIFGGYDVKELARASNYEETAYLLLKGELPTREQYDAFDGRLRRARFNHSKETHDVVDALADRGAAPMEMLRTAVSTDSFDDPLKDDNSEDANFAKTIGLIGRIPVIIARYTRRRLGLDPIEGDPELSHAANFLWMLHGERPSEQATNTFDTALILHADHEMNASTFTARVIASTLSDMHSAVVGAIGALKGPLHGGANEQVMRVLEELHATGQDPADAVREKLERKERIMGFGHRVYKTYDPRAVVLKEMARGLSREHEGEEYWFDLSEETERVVGEEKGLYANVDFYSASTYHYLGIPTDVFTPIFAMSRVAGWAANVIEQHNANRLIRPSSEYVGPALRSYVDIGQR